LLLWDIHFVIPELFEKMICDVITPIILPQISVVQHGFMKGHSNVTKLVELSNFVIDKIENGHQADGDQVQMSSNEACCVST
jgi:hypothetical protein